MKRAVAVILVVLGVTALLLGVGGLVLGRGTDTLTTPSTSIPLSTSVGIVSTRSVLPLDNVELVVTARAAEGKVFIGAAHPVDVNDYFGDQALTYVTQAGVGGIGTQDRTAVGTRVTDVTDPAAQAFWYAKASGAGTQTLPVRLTGAPIRYAVIPATPGTSVTLSQGLVIPHLRAAAIAAVLVGVVLVALGVVMWRRARRAGGSSAFGDSSAMPPPVSSPKSPDESTAPSAGSDSTDEVTQATRPRSLILAVPIVVMALAGCASMPQSAPEWKDATVTKTALTSAEVPAMLADYDKRNNAAIVQTHETGDPGAWATADDWQLLAVDTLSTRLHREQGNTTPPGQYHTTGDQAYSTTFGHYPMWTVVPMPTESADQKGVSLGLFTKPSVSASWLQSSVVGLQTLDLPAPLHGTAADPSDSEMARAVAAAAQVRDAVNGGTAEGAPALTGDLAQINTVRAAAANDVATVVSLMSFYEGTDKEQGDNNASVRVVRLAGGELLVLAAYAHSATFTARPGSAIFLKDESLARALAESGSQQTIVLRAACAAAMRIGTGGDVTMLGSTCQNVV